MKSMACFIFLVMLSCKQERKQNNITTASTDTVSSNNLIIETSYQQQENKINTGKTSVKELLDYAKTLIGTPYKYGSIDPHIGFDCSGFITHVFNHFNIEVPRSSSGFTNINREVHLIEAKPGDIVLFTGTDHSIKHVGHMGIITTHNNEHLEFIHSSSGKAHGVTLTPLNKQYMTRYMKIIRVFKENDR